MKIKVDIKLNPGAIKQLQQAQKQALEAVAEAIKSDIVSSAVVPKDTGELERSHYVDITEINLGKARIIADTPYARRLYWHPEYNFRKDKNPNAQGKWMQSYIDGEKKNFAAEAFSKLLKIFSKGLVK